MLVSKKLLVVCISVLMASGCGTMTARDIDTLPASAALPEKSVPGQVDVWFYDNVTVSSVDELEGLARFPDNPDEVAQLFQLDISGDRADNFGSLVRGYIIPPIDGQYRFFINSDDDSRFLLSTSAIPADARIIASVPGYTKQGDFKKYSSQVSASVTLSADQKYYFEVRHREGRGADRFSVAWEGPGFGQSIIDGQYLSSFAKTSQIYSEDEKSIAGYALGYRVGFFDGEQKMPFAPAYPPRDQDQDGLYDNWELFHGMSTVSASDANADRDDDILTNYDEFWVGSNPSNPDSDGDGIPDGAEFAYGLDPLDAGDAREDFDNDGFSNLEEYLAGSDLTDREDLPLQAESRVAGVWAQYFLGKSFNEFVVSKVEPGLNFSWGAGSPQPEIPVDNFSARYFTQFTAPHDSGTRDYQIIINRDDGVRMDFDGQRIVDAWTDAKARVVTQVAATAGQSYPVTVEYYERAGHATLSVQFVDTVTGQVQNPADIFTVLDFSNSANQSADSDSDGIPDIWEHRQGTNSYAIDSAVVNNAAGISNLEAFQSNLNPWTADVLDGEETTPPVVVIPPTTGPSQSFVTLMWTAPLTRVDGNSMPLGDIKGYELSYGREPESLNMKINVPGQDTRYTLEMLDKGQWYFQMRTYDNRDAYSAPTEVLEYTVK